MTYFLLVERRIWPLWIFWGLTVAAFIFALVDVRVIRIVVSSESISIRRAWGSRTIPLADLGEMRYVDFEYIVKPFQGRGPWFWIPRFVTNRDAILDRLQREIAANVVGRVRDVTPSQHAAVRASLREGAAARGDRASESNREA